MANGKLQFGDIIIIGQEVSGGGRQFLADEPNIDVNFNRTNPLQWEHFMILNAEYPASKGLVYAGDKVALLSYHGNYLTHDGSFVRSSGGEIEPDKVWTIFNCVPNTHIAEIICSSGAIQEGIIHIKASNGKMLNRKNNGDAIIEFGMSRVYYKIDEKYRIKFKIPLQNKIKFLNPSKETYSYSNQNLYVFKRHELLVVDLRGIPNDYGYFVELATIDYHTGAKKPTVFPDGSTGMLKEGSWLSKGKVPNSLVINELISNQWFGGSIPLSGRNGEFYSLKVAIGNPWIEQTLLFKVE